jgi:glycosyltransferase involved in cell wall biosynthesis
MFDYLSTLERKNPLGAMAAYQRAFSSDDGTVLIVKSVNARHRPERRAELTCLAQGRQDIVFLDDLMSAAERDALLLSCDCYISLHRSEGHGLPLAEAMASGKPVVATAYGGNTEFMTNDNSYLVRWTPASVGPNVEHYPAEARWAEPDIENAAHLLQAVRGNSQEARRKVHRARIDVEEKLSPAAIGAQMRERLREMVR